MRKVPSPSLPPLSFSLFFPLAHSPSIHHRIGLNTKALCVRCGEEISLITEHEWPDIPNKLEPALRLSQKLGGGRGGEARGCGREGLRERGAQREREGLKEREAEGAQIGSVWGAGEQYIPL